ncbi:MAG TPA: C25 family cysteine peptidase [Thermoanaerobaculia bacterium]|nr:C25 family cysteine peptidase [Thermoanaerobaculia bacterium]
MAQVVFDAASNAAVATTSTGNPVTVNWNHTVSLVKKPYIVVSVAIDKNGGAQTVTTVTFGSEAGGPNQAMTLLGSATNGTIDRAELWGLAGPTAGTHQITVSVANAGGQSTVVIAGAKSFTNVFQTASTGTAVAATGTSTTPAVAVTNSGFDYVVDAVSYNSNSALTAGAGQTNAFNVTAAASSGAGSIKTGAANTTMSWTGVGAQAWSAVAVPLQSANPQILFDAASSTTFASGAATFTGSWNHTTTSAANRYLVVGVNIDLSGRTSNSTGVVYGTEGGGPNSAMTALGSISNGTNVRTELWGLVAPATGTHQITVTVSNPSARNDTVVAGAQSFSGVDQANPTGTAVTGSNNSAIASVTTANSAYDYVVDAIAWNLNAALTPGNQQDGRYGIVTTTLTNFSGAGSGLRGYPNATMQWAPVSGGAQNWSMVAIPLHMVSVAVTKTASADVIKLGDSITYTLQATNYSSASVTTVTITDVIPANTTFVSQSGCSGTGTIVCNVGTLAPATSSALFTITVVANTAGTVSNVATVAHNGLATTNSSETVRTLAEGKVCASPGKDGTGGTLAGIKNDYWPGSSTVVAGATSLVVGARAAGAGGNTITAGDLLIVMQMQDAAFDTTNDETYGEGTGSTRATGTGSGAATSLNNAGRWEYVVATNSVPAAGGTLTVNAGGAGGGLLYGYTNQSFATTTTQGQRTYQVIRVPQYTTATLGSTLTALPWNGAVGGVLAIDVSGTMALGGATVSVDGLGYRGGGGRQLTGVGAGTTMLATDFRTLATLATNGSKAEGITGTPRYIYQNGANIGTPTSGNAPLDTGVEGYVGGSYGRGAPGNAGGGSTDGDPTSNGDNSGGGGGGNGGGGGPGGNGWACNCPSGGQGGGGISPSLTRITMGGGGGAGTTNNASAETCVAPPTCRVNVPTDWVDNEAGNGYYSSGANGGGAIIIRALQATGTATLTANGFTAYNTGRDGSGGGGAGGSVLLTTQIGTLSGVTIQAKGGNGGNAWLTTAPAGDPGERHGPGGGGGGGYVLLSSGAASTDVSGGQNGVTTSANSPYGAQPGQAGIVQLIGGNNVLPGGDGASCAIADLAVTNVVSAPSIQAGNNVTFTQTVTNNGPNTADGVVYMAPIPASATFVSISVPAGWTCITPAVGGTGVVLCTTPSLASAATANFSLVVNSFGGTPAGYVMSETNSVSSNTADSNPNNNKATATTIIESNGGSFADMAVTIAESTSVPVAGANINYTQVISNLGSVTASVPTYTITTPPNTTFQSLTPPAGWTCITPAVGGTGVISCSGSTLASGASVNMPLTFKVNAGTAVGTVITATPTVGSSTPEPYLPNNTASISATVVASGSGDVAVTISNSPNPVSPAETYTYTVVATNNGPAAASTDSVSIPLPAGTNFQSLSVPAGWGCVTPAVGSGGTITCTIASFAAGASATFSPVVQVNPNTADGTTLNITSTITTASTDSIPANNTASTSNLVVARTSADVGIVKTDSPDPVGVGQYITYRLTVTNNGPAIATNVTVNDPLPGTVGFFSATPSIGTCSGTTTINCTLGTLPVGNSQFVDVIVQANATGTVTNTATVTRTEADSIASNDSSTATTTVLAVTLVRLRDFTVTQDKGNVQIAWQTSYEFDNLGFNIYREVAGQQTKVNKQLIAGTALRSKRHDSEAGHAYRYNDKLDEGTFAQYWLEDVDTAGRHTKHGPVSPVAGTVSSPPNTAPLAGLGANGFVFTSPDGFGAAHATEQETATPAQYKQQLVLAADNGLKIYVSQEGWYRLTKAAMVAAGYDPGSDPRAITLSMLGAEQFITVDDGGDGKFDANDAIEFYGYPLDTVSTGARTYWLRSAKGGSGNRVAVSTTNGGDPITGSVAFTFDRIERSIFDPVASGDGDPFFGTLITTDSGTEPLTVSSNLDATYGGNATMDLVILGATDGAHVIDVAFNGHSLSPIALSNLEQKTFTFAVPQAWLITGTNSVLLTSRNGDEDVSVVVKSRLTYQHLLRADNGALDVNLAGGRAVTIGGFGSNSVRAIDVSDAQHPTELQTSVAVDPQGGFAATFTTLPGAARTVMAFDASRILPPGELAANSPSSWSDTNGNSNGSKAAADFYIVSNKSFLPAAATLKSVRDGEGTATAVVDVDDLYDEFNFGIRSPQAIRAFFQLAASWKHAPSAVLLLGDASVDPRNYLGVGTFDFVPTKLIGTTLLTTASDDWFTDFNNDGIADIPVGRIPVDTPDEAALVIGKIASRGTPSGTWARNALLIADHADDFDFGSVAVSLGKLLPSTITSQTIDFATTASPHSDIMTAMNNGSLLTTYIGHASVEIWADSVFSSSDALTLTNGSRLPVVIALDCLNGFFHDVFSESLAEALLKAPNGGAVAVWASSSLTQPDQQNRMGQELFRQLFGPEKLTLGQAVARAKVVATDPDVRKSWIFFGDPTMKLR